MAYTLQVGREAMEERLAVLVVTIEELEEKLEGFVKGQEDIEELYRGQVKQNKETVAVFTADEDLQKALDAWIAKGKYEKLLDLWVKGLIFNWEKLYEEIKPCRISLSTYPFAKERYWVPANKSQSSGSSAATISASVSFLHPLVQQNTSNASGLQFSSKFSGQEFFLRDHVVKGEKVLPGVAYLEMARAAMEQATGTLEQGKIGIHLKNIVWTQPIVVGEQAVQVHIGVYPEDNEEIGVSIPIYKSDINRNHSEMTSFFSGKTGESILQVLLTENNLEKIALYWVNGGKIQWESLHKGTNICRIFLPTYPFEKLRCLPD
jgi:polyketide synthase PksN